MNKLLIFIHAFYCLCVHNQLFILIIIIIEIKFSYVLRWTVSVTVPPRIIPFSFEKQLRAGSLVQLICTIGEGDSPIEVHWSAHGERIKPSTGIFTQRISERTSILSINSVGAEHRGTYSCQASNSAGVTNYTQVLAVNGTSVLFCILCCIDIVVWS